MPGIDYGLAESIVKKFATTGFKSMTKKSEDKVNGTVTYTLTFTTKSGDVSQDLTFSTGTSGKNGTNITSASWSGNDLVFTLSDNSTVVLINAKLDLKGDKGDSASASPDGKSLDVILLAN
jgi:hypothetical protein